MVIYQKDQKIKVLILLSMRYSTLKHSYINELGNCDPHYPRKILLKLKKFLIRSSRARNTEWWLPKKMLNLWFTWEGENCSPLRKRKKKGRKLCQSKCSCPASMVFHAEITKLSIIWRELTAQPQHQNRQFRSSLPVAFVVRRNIGGIGVECAVGIEN